MPERPGNATGAVLVALDLGEPDYAESLEELRTKPVASKKH